MPNARGWYVKATKLEWPNKHRLESGPFDDHAAAYAEAGHLRPFYPDATLEVVMEWAASLPVRTPRTAPPGVEVVKPMFDLSRIEHRRFAAQCLRTFCTDRGAAVTVDEFDGEPDVSASVPALHCNIWLAWTPAAPMPIISWRAARPGPALRDDLPGAWRGGGTLKATSKPETWPALFDALEIGLCAGIDGSAFDWSL